MITPVCHLQAALVHILGDFAVAEEIVQDALLVALEYWPIDGIPDRPDAWLHTVARRRALNQLSRDARYRAKLAQLGEIAERVDRSYHREWHHETHRQGYHVEKPIWDVT